MSQLNRIPSHCGNTTNHYLKVMSEVRMRSHQNKQAPESLSHLGEMYVRSVRFRVSYSGFSRAIDWNNWLILVVCTIKTVNLFGGFQMN